MFFKRKKRNILNKRSFIFIVCAVVLMSVSLVNSSSFAANHERKRMGYENAYKSSMDLLLEYTYSETDTDKADLNYLVYISEQTAPVYNGMPLEFTTPETLIDENGGELYIEINVPSDALYTLYFYYKPEGNYILPNIISLEIDGKQSYNELGSLQANNTWISEGFPLDRYGNECTANLVRGSDWTEACLRPSSGLYSKPMQIMLTKGSHNLKFICKEGGISIKGVRLSSYSDYSENEFKTGGTADGDNITIIEAEQINRRNNPNIRTAGEYNTAISPYSTGKRLQNHIDEESFRYGGCIVEYDFYIEKSGYYNIASDYRQSFKTEFQSYRNLYIDGVIPSENFFNVDFYFTRNFKRYVLPETVYLETGYHTLGVEVNLDYIEPSLEIIKTVVNEMNALALEISTITGGNTDKYRDFKLSDYQIDGGLMLTGWADILDEVYKELYIISGTEKSSSGEIEPLKTASALLRNLAKKPDELPKRLEEFSYSERSARQYLTQVIESIQYSQLGFDKFLVYQDSAELPAKPSFFESLMLNIGRFFNSFGIQEYAPDYGNNDDTTIEVWVNRPRQYLEIIQSMTDISFTNESGIKVNLSMVPDQQKLILANASGTAPDAVLSISTGQVYDLAVRGALADMREFSTFKEVAGRFAPGMLIPGAYDGGLYAMPETFNFWMLFYRSDILESLGLKVPETMDEVRGLLPQLRRMGMNFNSHVSNFVAKPLLATTPFIFQNNGSLYNENGLSNLDSAEVIKGLTLLIENYTIYNMRFNITSFYQYFRDGRTPVGISDYHTFNLLTNAAPELAGNWGVALYPGVMNENGDIERWTSGAAESNIIFESSDMKQQAWDYIDWWMSDDIQTQFSFSLQTTMGNEYMWNSANLEAIKNAPWNKKHKDVIVEQLSWTYEAPRVPGDYMMERELSNIVNSSVSDGVKLQLAIDEAHKRVNRELKRKLEEFGYIKDGEMVRVPQIVTVETIKEWIE